MWKRGGLALMILTMVAVSAGCQQTLFPRDAARSPYERYMALRGQDRPQKELDAFGREQPALRERLRPLAQP